MDIHPAQTSAIALTKARPDDSFLLCGRNGTGKTHLSWALYRRAVVSGRKAVGLLLADLLDSYKKFELLDQAEKARAMRDYTPDRPPILPDDLKTDERRFTLFLDEFEKARPSEFACECLFRLLNAARDFNHQLIITSNLDWNGMRERWSKIDDVYGNSIMTRLQDCHLIELF
jgi:DNA replication protein DnaC